MPTTKTSFVSYASRDVNTVRGPGKVTEFNSIEGTKYSTWNAALASQVKTMLNQPVIVEYETKQNGDYTNYYLQKVTPVLDVIGGGAEDVADQTLSPAPKPSEDPKAASIAKAVALKAAVDTLGKIPVEFKDSGQIIALAEIYETYLGGSN